MNFVEAPSLSLLGDSGDAVDIIRRFGDLRAIAQDWLDRFNRAVSSDPAILTEIFHDESYWRDMVAASSNIQTVAGGKNIAQQLPGLFAKAQITDLELEDDGPNAERLGCYGQVISAVLRFRTAIGAGRGHVRLQPTDGGAPMRALTFLTTLQTLDQYRSTGAGGGGGGGQASLDDIEPVEGRRLTIEDAADAEVLVVGGGQAGLAIAARLKNFGISTVIIERNSYIGDNWRNRYDSLHLHNETCASHLPYLPIPNDWPNYLPKDLVGDYLENYSKELKLDVVTEAELVHADFRGTYWTVELRDSHGKTATVEPKFIVMATGVTGVVPRMPEFPGSDEFQGKLIHSSQYTGSEDVVGREVIVVGAGTSGHDIAQDLHIQGAVPLLVQRSSTTIVSLDSANVQYASYRATATGSPINDIDLAATSVPNLLTMKLWVALTEEAAERDKVLLDGLKQAGFALDFGLEGAGFVSRALRQYGGYYIDVGASQLIIDGKIRLKSGVGVQHLTEHGVVFTDGSSADAEMIVMATGFEPMQEYIRQLFGDEVAERVGPVWGMDDQSGELMGIWRQTDQPRFFVNGGGLMHCRIYSRYIALQIAAQLQADSIETANNYHQA
jgi:cation diffusion facilitator CzcD-associated flavoprotein CzcO